MPESNPWKAKETGAYARESEEALANATAIWGFLKNAGWTLNAVSGLLGNVEIESGYNPWRWQSDDILSTSDTTELESNSHGYGLFQFTPANKYLADINARENEYFAPNYSNRAGYSYDGYSQLSFVNDYADYINSGGDYDLTYSQYKASAESADYLALAWMYNYERPAASSVAATAEQRQEAAIYWYATLQGEEPPTPPEPEDARWKTKDTGTFERESEEAAFNADRFKTILEELGWTLESICAVLGNIELESGYNPWKWSDDEILSTTDTEQIESNNRTYGLFAFKPPSLYCLNENLYELLPFGPNYSNRVGNVNDGDVQTFYMATMSDIYEPQTTGPKPGRLTFKDFQASKIDPRTLAVTWMNNFEKANAATVLATTNQRKESAIYWYGFFGGRLKKRGMPLWMKLYYGIG